MAATIQNSSAAVYTGTWTANAGGYGGVSYHYIAGGTGLNKATWTFTALTAGVNYALALAWNAFSNRGTNCTWKILDSDGTTVLATGTIDQTKVAQGGLQSGFAFAWLTGFVAPTGTSLSVQWTDQANNFVTADAALIQPASDALVCTAKATGNWSSAATWLPRTPTSGSGDSACIASGVVLTLDLAALVSGSYTVGSSPNTGGTPAIQSTQVLSSGTNPITAACGLTLGGAYTLRVQGDIKLNGNNASPFDSCDLTLPAGASLIFDPPSAQQYVLSFNNPASLTSNGSSGSRCTVKTDTARGGLACYMTASGAVSALNTFGAVKTASYTDFSFLGDAGHNGVWSIQNSPLFTGLTGVNFSITNCTFDHCNFWSISEHAGPSNWVGTLTFSGNAFTNSIATTAVSGQSLTVGFSYNNQAGATVLIQANSFDGSVQMDGGTNLTWTGNTFGGGWNLGNTAAWNSDAYFHDNVVVNSALVGTSSLPMGPIKNCYFVNTSGSSSFLYLASGASATNCLFEQPVAGDGLRVCIYAVGSTAAAIKGNIALPNSTGGAIGALVAPIGTTGQALTIEHNLRLGLGSYGLVVLGQGTAALAGMVASVRSNLATSTTAGASNFALAENGGSSTFTNNAVTVAGYNGFRNPSSGTCKYNAGVSSASINGYSNLEVGNANPFPNAALGTGDLIADPQFADNTRNLGMWNVSQGGANSYTAALARLAGNPALITQAGIGLMPWVRAGYAPTNQAFANATYPGDTLTLDANGNALGGAVGPMAVLISTATAPSWEGGFTNVFTAGFDG